MTNYGLIGGDTPIDDLIALYFPGRPANALYQVFESEQAALMACLLLEMRGEVSEGTHDESNGDYYSGTVVCDGSQEPISLEWSPDRWDLRFDDDITVTFTDENRENATVTYFREESPVVGIPVRTSFVGIGAAESATSTPTVRVQGWQG